MSVLRSFASLLGLLSLAAGPLRSQDTLTVEQAFNICQGLHARNAVLSDDATRQSNAWYAQNRDNQETQTPLGTTTAAAPLNTEVSLTTGEQEGRGLISYTYKAMDAMGTTGNLSLQASVPFDKSQGQALFASLEGISGDYVISGAWTQTLWDLEPGNYGNAICQVCRDRGMNDPTKCNLNDLRAGGMTEGELEAIEDRLFGQVTTKFFGGEGSFGRRERSFFAPSATKDAEDRPAYSLALFGGMRGDTWSLTGRATGKREYKEGNKATLCSPIGSGLESCETLPLGEAKGVESLVATLEGRFFFRKCTNGSKAGLKRFAIAPSAQYDFESDIWALSAPIFLTRNSKDEFTGGLRLSWRSDVDDLSLAVIVVRGFATP